MTSIILPPAQGVNDSPVVSRRGALLLSATAVALLAGRETLADAGRHASGQQAGDVQILNQALAAEFQAIAAYGVGAGSGLLTGGTLALAATFRGHHEQHAQALDATVRKLGGKPVAALPDYHFPLATLKSSTDVLRFAAGLEKQAVSAYLGAVPAFADRELAKTAASILGDEAMHWAVLRQALGDEPVPAAFVS